MILPANGGQWPDSWMWAGKNVLLVVERTVFLLRSNFESFKIQSLYVGTTVLVSVVKQRTSSKQHCDSGAPPRLNREYKVIAPEGGDPF